MARDVYIWRIREKTGSGGGHLVTSCSSYVKSLSHPPGVKYHALDQFNPSFFSSDDDFRPLGRPCVSGDSCLKTEDAVVTLDLLADPVWCKDLLMCVDPRGHLRENFSSPGFMRNVNTLTLSDSSFTASVRVVDLCEKEYNLKQ